MTLLEVTWLLFGVLLGALLKATPKLPRALLVLLDENGRAVGPRTFIGENAWTTWRAGSKQLRRDVLVPWRGPARKVSAALLYTEWGEGRVTFDAPLDAEPGMTLSISLEVFQGRQPA